ncbi:MAG: hypothetical protein EOM51_04295 [Clostridia bacterium]|nr:hypothetical protein [Clostridia bacterium]
MKYFLCLAGFAVVAALDFPTLIKSKKRRELAIYSAIFIMVLAFAVLVVADGTMKSTIQVIKPFYRDILHLSFKKA